MRTNKVQRNIQYIHVLCVCATGEKSLKIRTNLFCGVRPRTLCLFIGLNRLRYIWHSSK